MTRFLLLLLSPITLVAQQPPVIITSPKADAVVGVKETVTGTFKEGWPVVAVKTPNGDVYVQQMVTAGRDKTFTGEAYFGDKDNTGRGTRYELFTLVAPSQEEAKTLKSGLQKNLPKWPTTKPVFVFRDERIVFGGQTWAVKKFAKMDPGPNKWTDDKTAIFLDKKGHLNLNIVKDGKGWACTELVCNDSLGFGTYTWTYRADLATFDSQAVLGLFTYQNSANSKGIPDKEIDFEMSRWGNPKNELGQFVLQPYIADNKKNIQRFEIPTNVKQPITAKYVWSKGKVEALCTDAAGKELQKWSYETDTEKGVAVPPAEGKEKAIINLWLFQGKAPQLGKPVGVVVESFSFTK